ncbi:MAG: hypothetical protein R3230_00090 [Nitrosopumilaceae archaeon]|nr:hypothetical protein [Nitrosopumilaceae archaeon]
MTNELLKQPKMVTNTFDFMCKHCNELCSRLTVTETNDGSIIKNDESFEGKYFEIVENGPYKGLKISTCDCEDANEGVSINNGDVIKYYMIDSNNPDGVYLDAVVHINQIRDKEEIYNARSG